MLNVAYSLFKESRFKYILKLNHVDKTEKETFSSNLPIS